MKKVSRQRRWQIAQMKMCNCQICANPSQGRSRCDACAKRISKVKYRKPLKSQWAAVDWSEKDRVIAGRFGLTPTAVYYQRRKHFETIKP